MRYLLSAILICTLHQCCLGQYYLGPGDAPGKWVDVNFYLRHNGFVPGYIVYRSDTIRGTLWAYAVSPFVAHNIMVTTADGKDHKYRLSNRHVSTVGLDGYIVFKKLFPRGGSLKKMERSNKFYRVAHDGKLCIYDDQTLPNQCLNWNYFVLSYNGKVIAYSPFTATAGKRKLVNALNDCYGLQLNPEDYSTQQLWEKVRTLN